MFNFTYFKNYKIPQKIVLISWIVAALNRILILEAV